MFGERFGVGEWVWVWFFGRGLGGELSSEFKAPFEGLYFGYAAKVVAVGVIFVEQAVDAGVELGGGVAVLCGRFEGAAPVGCGGRDFVEKRALVARKKVRAVV